MKLTSIKPAEKLRGSSERVWCGAAAWGHWLLSDTSSARQSWSRLLPSYGLIHSFIAILLRCLEPLLCTRPCSTNWGHQGHARHSSLTRKTQMAQWQTTGESRPEAGGTRVDPARRVQSTCSDVLVNCPPYLPCDAECFGTIFRAEPLSLLRPPATDGTCQAPLWPQAPFSADFADV